MKLPFKKLACLTLLPALMVGCATHKIEEKSITPTDLMHHNWVLTEIDGNLLADNRSEEPSARLEIGEHMKVNGNAGCNNFFGQGELANNQFKVSKMGMTMKMCPPLAMEIEQTMQKTLSQWSDISLSKNELILKNSEHTLTFELKDWVY